MSPGLKHSIKRILSLPPHIVLKKLLIMGKNRWQLYRIEKADQKKSTYSSYESKLHSFVTLPITPPPISKHISLITTSICLEVALWK